MPLLLMVKVILFIGPLMAVMSSVASRVRKQQKSLSYQGPDTTLLQGPRMEDISRWNCPEDKCRFVATCTHFHWIGQMLHLELSINCLLFCQRLDLAGLVSMSEFPCVCPCDCWFVQSPLVGCPSHIIFL